MILRPCLMALFLVTATPLASEDSSTAPSQETVRHDARLAAQQLLDAGDMLAGAESAENRIRALTQAVRAYETSLTVLRTGLAQASLREVALQDKLAAREADMQRLLGTLMAIERAGVPSSFMHPAGALGTLRSGMILAELTPALERQTAELRSELQDLRELATLQRDATENLAVGLKGVETARAALTQALDERSDLPRRFIEDPVKTALLVAASETMTDFAGSLDIIATSLVPGSLPDIADRRGHLSLPVADSAVAQGESVSTRPALHLTSPDLALVTTPVPATLRYRGPLLDYGNVVILEPQTGILIVLAGLGTVFGEIGQVLPGGSPVGWMPGSKAPAETDVDAHLSGDGTTAGSQQTQTLYIEVRENNIPVDPLTWFAVTEG